MNPRISSVTFENDSWAGAEIFAWDANGHGTEIGRAHFTSMISDPPRVAVQLTNGRHRDGFTTPGEALAWIEANA